MLIAHLEESFPNFINERPNLKDLEQFYKESKVRFDKDENFKAVARNNVVKLQSGDPGCLLAWNILCDISREEF